MLLSPVKTNSPFASSTTKGNMNITFRDKATYTAIAGITGTVLAAALLKRGTENYLPIELDLWHSLHYIALISSNI